MMEDKENCRPVAFNRQQTSGKSSAFGRLLKEVTTEMTMEADSKFAMHSQMEEASKMASQWMQEEKDLEAANKLGRQLADEDKMSRLKEVEVGEKAALQLAMEERRRILAEEKRARELESKDMELARNLEVNEAKEHETLVQLCQGDEELAQRIDAMLRDEMLAEEVQRQEMLADQKIRSQRAKIEKEDEELARKEEELLQKKEQLERAKQLENDSIEAKLIQEITDTNERLERKKLELRDAEMSQRMQIQAYRQDHRQQRKAELISSGKSSSIKDHEALVNQWEECDAECEDVAGGIVLTLFLPELRDLKVRVDGNLVEVTAFRALQSTEKASSRAASYVAEFCIRGPNVNIQDSDISFEYASETGLLFVYVEKVQMNMEGDNKSGPSASSRTNIFSNGKMVMGAVRDKFTSGLSKMFSSGKSRK